MTVICHVCEDEFEAISPRHLESKHKMSVKEYREFCIDKGVEPIFKSEKTLENMTKSLNASDEEVLESIKELKDELGHVPTKEEYDNKGRFGEGVVKNRFGSWNDALRKNDFKVSKQPGTEKYQIIRDLQNASDKVQGVLSQKKYRNKGSYSVDTVQRKFGSWSKAKIEAAVQ